MHNFKYTSLETNVLIDRAISSGALPRETLLLLFNRIKARQLLCSSGPDNLFQGGTYVTTSGPWPWRPLPPPYPGLCRSEGVAYGETKSAYSLWRYYATGFGAIK